MRNDPENVDDREDEDRGGPGVKSEPRKREADPRSGGFRQKGNAPRVEEPSREGTQRRHEGFPGRSGGDDAGKGQTEPGPRRTVEAGATKEHFSYDEEDEEEEAGPDPKHSGTTPGPKGPSAPRGR